MSPQFSQSFWGFGRSDRGTHSGAWRRIFINFLIGAYLVKQYRHGDVMIEEIRTIPDLRQKAQHLILAHGELTGHCHRIAERDSAILYDTPIGMVLHVLRDTATLVHDEHDSIELGQGYYRVWRQREYSPEGNRVIRD